MPLIRCFGPLIAIGLPLASAVVAGLIPYIYVYHLGGDIFVAAAQLMLEMILLVLIMDSFSERLAKCRRSYLINPDNTAPCKR